MLSIFKEGKIARKKLIRTSEFPYHVTNRSNNKEWFYIDLNTVWNFCRQLIAEGEKKFNVKVEAFVLMNNHYHMLLFTPEANIDKFMQFFNHNLSKKISRAANRINKIFGASYHWTIIHSQEYYLNVVRYIYQNPLRANLASHCQLYPYSNLNERPQFFELIEWINIPMNAFDYQKTKKNLRKSTID